MSAKLILEALYPQLAGLLIPSDDIETNTVGSALHIVTGAGQITIHNGAIRITTDCQHSIIRGIDESSPLYVTVLALEMQRLSLIHTVLLQGAVDVSPFMVRAS